MIYNADEFQICMSDDMWSDKLDKLPNELYYSIGHRIKTSLTLGIADGTEQFRVLKDVKYIKHFDGISLLLILEPCPEDKLPSGEYISLILPHLMTVAYDNQYPGYLEGVSKWHVTLRNAALDHAFNRTNYFERMLKIHELTDRERQLLDYSTLSHRLFLDDSKKTGVSFI